MLRHPAIRPLRMLVVLGGNVLALIVLDQLLHDLNFDHWFGAVLLALAVGLLGSFVQPILARYALPLSVLSLGLFTLVLDGAIIALGGLIAPEAEVGDLGTAIAAAAGLAVITAILHAALTIDDDESWHRTVIARLERAVGEVEETEVPGVLFLEIDGLAHDVLQRAMLAGDAPTLASWWRSGDYRLERWETDWSSQTGACQAGILHGNSREIPAFRWWEKDQGRAMVTNHPRDAAEIERRVSDGRGLLHAGGASRANIVSGDATHSLLTMSTVLQTGRGPIGRGYGAYFSRPSAVVRTFLLFIVDVVRERYAAVRQARDQVEPRINRGMKYAMVRAFATVIQRDLQVAAVISDILAGRPAVYTTFLAYDEVAHHSGVERHDTLEVLRRVDRAIRRIAAAIPEAPRPYRMVLLSDHGQTQGATFRDRFGITLEELVREAVEPGAAIVASGGDEALAQLGAGLTEVSRRESRAGAIMRRATRDLDHDDDDEVVTLGAAHGHAAPEDLDELPELVVMASGCLGTITFPREPGRVTMERLEEMHPRLLDALRCHPGIGFVFVRSEQEGPLVLGPRGFHWLRDGKISGEDPLAPFGPNAARHILRTDGMEHCPDIMVNSTYWKDVGEVAAFEQLVGSHGGMGGLQTFPFVMFPSDLPYPDEPVVGPDALHHEVLRVWMRELGHTEFAEPVEPETSVAD